MRLKRVVKNLDALVHGSFLVTFLLQRDYSKYLKLFIINQFKSSNGKANTLTGYHKYQTIAASLSHISVWQTNTKPRHSCPVYLIFLQMKVQARRRKGIWFFEWLRTGNLRGVKFFPVLPRNPDSEQTCVRTSMHRKKEEYMHDSVNGNTL